ncbi:MAG: hypothetical protein MI923_25465 [Phycisphaerales bacterium]|nr:hypothetical protein [Phycisphaerales bacterium]
MSLDDYELFCLIATDDSSAVAKALECGPWVFSVYRSGYTGHREVRLQSEGLLDLEYEGIDSGPDACYFLNGGIDWSNDQAKELVKEVCNALKTAGLGYQLEIYDGDHHLIKEERFP